MQSRILCQLPIDERSVVAEAHEIAIYPSYYSYTECIGDWRSYTLYNNQGNERDFIFRSSTKSGSCTELGKHLKYIKTFIEENFDTTKLVQARAFSMRDAVVFPHRDFIEVNEAYIRLQIPLITHSQAYHAEEDVVFRMRIGEVWHLAATNVHSAANLGDRRRLNLCLDFENTDQPIQLLKKTGDTLPLPDIVVREEPSENHVRDIIAIGRIARKENIKDIIKLVLKEQYLMNITPAEIYDLLIKLSEQSRDMDIIRKVRTIRDYMTVERAVGKLLTAWDNWNTDVEPFEVA